MTLLRLDSTALLYDGGASAVNLAAAAARRGWTAFYPTVNGFSNYSGPRFQRAGPRAGSVAVYLGDNATAGGCSGLGFDIWPNGALPTIPSSGTLIIGARVLLTTGRDYEGVIALSQRSSGGASNDSVGPALRVDSSGVAHIFYNYNFTGYNYGSFVNDIPGVPTASGWMAGSGTHWYYFEFKVDYTINVSSNFTFSNFHVRIDGTPRIDDTTHTFSGNSADPFLPAKVLFYVRLDQGGGVSGAPAVTDIYVCDGTGTRNNDFLGPIQVECLRPTADASHSDWAKVGGGSSHTSAVNETATDDDTAYLKANLTGLKETFTMSDLAATSGAVKGISLVPISRKDTSAAADIRGLVRVGGNDFQATVGSDMLQALYRATPGRFDINPSTGNPWTIAEINALEAGFILAG